MIGSGTMPNHILIVDDEPAILDTLSSILQDEGYEISLAKDGQEALRLLRADAPPDLVLLDIWMPDLDGIETLRRALQTNPRLLVVMMSGHGSIESAVKAIKLGAYDYIEKPLSLEKITILIKHALHERNLEQENRSLKEQVARRVKMVGESVIMNELRHQIAMAGPAPSRVLISGENGTGKELVARAIHLQSPRAEQPFIEVNCAAIPETLIESELFGHERGSFTGASSTRRGQFELADGGTLFLDEVGDMSLATQAKVLRVLQEQRFQRVGGTKLIKVDVRVIAASNKNLVEEIRKNTFREDLYFRLAVLQIDAPPLRERREDIPLLVEHFMQTNMEEQGLRPRTFTPEALEVLARHDWPGNVRELRNLVERVVIMARGAEIQEADVAPLVRQSGEIRSPEVPSAFDYASLRDARAAFEREYIGRKLREHGWNVSKTADDLKVERSHLHRKIKLLNIEVRPES
ncbi:MAG TPA: sigma-54 dependent transcriptional regulator [Nitrospirales bacterium]|nr:sigma-54 dependent transcriptional regulator [Nitrospirales bacterium]